MVSVPRGVWPTLAIEHTVLECSQPRLGWGCYQLVKSLDLTIRMGDKATKRATKVLAGRGIGSAGDNPKPKKARAGS